MTDVLRDDRLNLSNEFKFSVASDVANGMAFLHSRNIHHGHLRSSCCLIDAKWTVKISDWEYSKLLQNKETSIDPALSTHDEDGVADEQTLAFLKFWSAPEILNAKGYIQPTAISDVYSYAMLLQEIFTREDPFSELAGTTNPTDVLTAIKINGLRPQHGEDTPLSVRQIMESAWSDETTSRPSFEQIQKMLRHANPSKKGILDSIIESMEEYQSHLEGQLENKDAILYKLTPYDIAERLANGKVVLPRRHDCITLLCARLSVCEKYVGTEHNDPARIIETLGEIQETFERIAKKYGVFNAYCQADQCIFVSPPPKRGFSTKKLTRIMVRVAMEIVATIRDMRQQGFMFDVLLGLHW